MNSKFNANSAHELMSKISNDDEATMAKLCLKFMDALKKGSKVK